MTGVEARIEIAFRHFGHIILVQKFALISLLAQSTQPMLAHYCLIAPNVTKGTRCCFSAGGFDIKITDGGTGLVHASEGEGLSPELIPQGRLDIEVNMLDGCNQQLHLEF